MVIVGKLGPGLAKGALGAFQALLEALGVIEASLLHQEPVPAGRAQRLGHEVKQGDECGQQEKEDPQRQAPPAPQLLVLPLVLLQIGHGNTVVEGGCHVLLALRTLEEAAAEKPLEPPDPPLLAWNSAQ